MALSASVNTAVSPVEMTVTSDRRKIAPVSGTVESAGEVAPWTATFPNKPIVVKDSAGVVIPHTTKSDNGLVAVIIPAIPAV